MGVMSVRNHEGATDIVMEKETERVRSRWRSGSRMETPEERCQGTVREESGGDYSAVVLCFLCIGVAVSH